MFHTLEKIWMSEREFYEGHGNKTWRNKMTENSQERCIQDVKGGLISEVKC